VTYRPFRPFTAIAMVTVAAVLAPLGPASATARQAQLSVYFLRGEQLAPVTRPGVTPTDAMQQLVAGPTRAEIALGFRTYLPRGTRLRSVKVSHRVATVDLDARFGSVRGAGGRLAGLSQIVRTLTRRPGTAAVRLLVNGKPPTAEFPRLALGRCCWLAMSRISVAGSSRRRWAPSDTTSSSPPIPSRPHSPSTGVSVRKPSTMSPRGATRMGRPGT